MLNFNLCHLFRQKFDLLECNKTTLSSDEYEYSSLTPTIAEVSWIAYLLSDLHVPLLDPPTLLCDNRSAISMSVNLVSHAHSKHIDLDYHFVHGKTGASLLCVQFVPSDL